MDVQREPDPMQKMADDLNAGLPLPAVDPWKLKGVWRALKNLGPMFGSSKATGVGAIAAIGGPTDLGFQN